MKDIVIAIPPARNTWNGVKDMMWQRRSIIKNMPNIKISKSINTEGKQEKEYEFCLRCGRKLKNPEARRLGMGIVCKSKMEVKRRKNLIDLYYSQAYNKDVGSHYPGKE